MSELLSKNIPTARLDIKSRRTLSWLQICISILAVCLWCGVALAQEDLFAEWVKSFRKEAVVSGIAPEVFDEAFRDMQPLDRVLQLYRSQPEFRLSFAEYLKLVAPENRIAEGRAKLAENLRLLEKISADYGVPPHIIVALWGVESAYGQKPGNFLTIQALATLAFDSKRKKFFRAELISALKIINSGDVTHNRMLGSWAGATGQCQFMPSSFRRFAVDHDADGRRDIWESRADIFASIANYLSRSGWRRNEPWGQEVRLPERFDLRHLKGKRKMTVKQWQSMGVAPIEGEEFPAAGTQASLIQTGKDGSFYMVYHNWHVLMKWNRSIFFATAAGYLADRIR